MTNDGFHVGAIIVRRPEHATSLPWEKYKDTEFTITELSEGNVIITPSVDGRKDWDRARFVLAGNSNKLSDLSERIKKLTIDEMFKLEMLIEDEWERRDKSKSK